MSIAEILTLVFFIAGIIIFFAKILNIMTYKFQPGEKALRIYGKEMSVLTFVITLVAWLFVFLSFSASATEIPFLEQYGLPITSYLEYGVLLSMMNMFLVLNGIFTFIELLLLLYAESRQGTERYRYGEYDINKKR